MVLNQHGGRRPGSGRPRLGRKKRTVHATDKVWGWFKASASLNHLSINDLLEKISRDEI